MNNTGKQNKSKLLTFVNIKIKKQKKTKTKIKINSMNLNILPHLQPILPLKQMKV